MVYRIRNIEKDEFVTMVLEEIVQNLKNENDNSIVLKEVINEENHSKGVEIQEIVLLLQEMGEVIPTQAETVILGLVSAGIWDIIKNIINKYRNLHEYNAVKEIEIEQENNDGHKTKIKVSLKEILNK